MKKNGAIFRELSPPELLSVNGGEPISSLLSKLSPWAALAAVAIYVYDNWDEFVEGVKEGYESTQNK
ncbi:MAG: lactobin A/cerein 7B family class IIb bacteriocin [Clostridia bacterium]|nr:lactobin A/cerein 7B family class IIb bacteriocin [Clostridia bacterium]